MRVVILDLKWSYGIESMSSEICRQLRKHAEVTVLAASESTLSDCIKLAPSKTYKDMLVAFFNPLLYLRVMRHLARLRPDVMYIISPHMAHAIIAVLCRVFTRVYVISHIHDTEHCGGRIVGSVANAVAFIQSKVSHRIYCCGETIKQSIVGKFRVNKARIAVFRLGPEQTTHCDRYKTGSDRTDYRYISMIGTIQERKGVDVFLRAAVHFNEVFGADKVDFLLAGSGDLQKYRAFIDKLPNLVVHNRFISDDEVNRFLARSYALVLPYVRGMMQSSFIPIAYGNGCPVIVSNIGSMHEVVENDVTGYVVHKNDAEQLAVAFSNVYSKRTILSSNCLRYYKTNFSWDRIGEHIHSDMAVALRAYAYLSPAALPDTQSTSAGSHVLTATDARHCSGNHHSN